MKLKYEDKNPFGGLEPDEPWFFVRARDVIAMAALNGYLEGLRKFQGVVKGQSSLEQNIKEIIHLKKLFRDWQAGNKVRMPKAAEEKK